MADVRDNGSQIQGNAAHDAADVGHPVKIGGKCSSAAPAASDSADRVDAWFDQNGRLMVRPGPPSSAGVSAVAGSASAVTLASAAADRVGLLLFNDSTVAAYVKYGTGASTSSYTVKMQPGDYFEMPQPIYQGAVTGIWASATGQMLVTVLSQ